MIKKKKYPKLLLFDFNWKPFQDLQRKSVSEDFILFLKSNGNSGHKSQIMKLLKGKDVGKLRFLFTRQYRKVFQF